ncbi:spermatogenesis-associated serine-rich protein 1-like [Acanthaster planci]|uniref:Spermatogenesis-associated serine-rich protein 1-like n=1 Tax=Acanthaster planci TaxID=133434 RepID=A0A8B7ZQE2_ACAPL|nr:spermatogenesis-associated serine-rich protein 1-like [Acanthaster planci]
MALHVTTEIGIPGRKERERRHFPERRGYEKSTVRGRRYIPHGQGSEPDWQPHPHCLQVKYSEQGPDWSSRLRYIPAPTEPEPREDYRLPSLRCFPGRHARSYEEWTFYPEGFHVGRRCQFPADALPEDKNHLASITSTNEVTHSEMLGMNRKLPTMFERRGFYPQASPGDKSYQASEYSPKFHMFGSTRPVVNFGGPPKRKPDTFVPLQELPPYPCEPYKSRERRRNHKEELESVRLLDIWEPAMPLGLPFGCEDRKFIAV